MCHILKTELELSAEAIVNLKMRMGSEIKSFGQRTLVFLDFPGWEANLGYFNFNFKVQVLAKHTK